MKIKTKEAIKDLAGKDIKNKDDFFTVGIALSNILLEAKVGGKMKLFILAKKCFEEKEIDVDDADLAIIKQAVEATEQYTNLVTGQLLQLLERKEVKEK